MNNKFGEGVICTGLVGKTYVLGCACLSIQAEMLSYANAHPEMFTRMPGEADNIVVLGCQVTDLAVLNDIRSMEALQEAYPGKKYFMGGCLSRRFDIQLPEGVHRLDHMREDKQVIHSRWVIDWKVPFWTKDAGTRFRDSYPVRVGGGCAKKCSYCTIKITRGDAYDLLDEAGIKKMDHEIKLYENPVIIADSPTVRQIALACRSAIDHKKKISLRNIEPDVFVAARPEIHTAIEAGVIDTLHVPVQSDNSLVLEDMCRPSKPISDLFETAQMYKGLCTFATNIIVDYKDFPNPQSVYNVFDDVSWNPYWDGKWDREEAKKRWTKYLS